MTPLSRNGAFMKLWIGETISLIGSAITSLALPLTALTLLHATPLDMGLLLACSAGAGAVSGLFAGVWADRLPQRGLLLWSNIGRALIIAAIPVAYLLGGLALPILFVAAVLTGILDSVFGAAYQSFMPSLVGGEALVGANSRFEGSRVLATLLGATLSGVLIALLTAPVALFIDAGSFLVAALSIVLIRQQSVGVRAQRTSLWREMRAGLGFVFAQPILRTILIMAVLFNFFAPMLNGQLVLYVTRVLGLSPVLLGLGFSFAGLAGVSMAVVAPRIIARLGMGRTVVVAAFFVAFGWALLPLAGGALPVLLGLLLAGVGIGTMGDVLINISAGSLRQAVTPPQMQGRVGSTIRVLVAGLQPLGAIAGGVIAQTYGVRMALFIFGGGFMFTFLVLLASPLRRARVAATSPELAPQVATPVAA